GSLSFQSLPSLQLFLEFLFKLSDPEGPTKTPGINLGSPWQQQDFVFLFGRLPRGSEDFRRIDKEQTKKNRAAARSFAEVKELPYFESLEVPDPFHWLLVWPRRCIWRLVGNFPKETRGLPGLGHEVSAGAEDLPGDGGAHRAPAAALELGLAEGILPAEAEDDGSRPVRFAVTPHPAS
ncbi:unnamed protein product, partial [Effrenium voratum]